MELNQIIDKTKLTAGKLNHSNSGEVALKAAAVEIEDYVENGGVIHYQRNLNQVTDLEFFQSVLIDLVWIERYFGKIERLKQYRRLSNESKQLFLTIRLKNKLIVQYGLNSLQGLEPTFSFDFSSKGYNLDFDDQVQAPIRLNTKVQKKDTFETMLTDKELNSVWEFLSVDIKGGN